MAQTEQEENLARINKTLTETLGIVRSIAGIGPPATRLEANLERELRVRKLTTNDPG